MRLTFEQIQEYQSIRPILLAGKHPANPPDWFDPSIDYVHIIIETLTSTPPAYSLQRLMAVVLAARSQYIKLMTKDYPNDDLEFGAPRLTRLSIGRDTVNSIEALTAEDIAFAERFRGLADAK